MSFNEPVRTTVEANDSCVTLNTIINIEDWVINDSMLLCRSSNTDNIFYRFDPVTFCLIDSFGTFGQGPDEYVTPRIVKSDGQKIILADIAQGAFICDSEKSHCPNNNCYNTPFEINYPVIGYTELRGPDRYCIAGNIQTGETTDSLALLISDRPSTDIPLEYKSASNGEYVVLAQQFYNEITVIKLNDKGQFGRIICYRGNDKGSDIKPYYIDLY